MKKSMPASRPSEFQGLNLGLTVYKTGALPAELHSGLAVRRQPIHFSEEPGGALRIALLLSGT